MEILLNIRFAISRFSHAYKGGPGMGGSIVDMCLTRASNLRVSDFPFHHDLSQAMEIFHWLFLPTVVGRMCVNDENLHEISRDNKV